MRFTVTYRPAATNDLARIWLLTMDPQAVADASDYIDRILKLSADRLGVDFESFRRLRVEPLEVDYTVSTDDCYVEVIRVRLIAD